MKVTALIAATLFVLSAHATETAPAHKGHTAAPAPAAKTATTTTTTTTGTAEQGNMPAPGTAAAAAPMKHDCKTMKGAAKKACMEQAKAATAPTTTTTETK